MCVCVCVCQRMNERAETNGNISFVLFFLLFSTSFNLR